MSLVLLDEWPDGVTAHELGKAVVEAICRVFIVVGGEHHSSPVLLRLVHYGINLSLLLCQG